MAADTSKPCTSNDRRNFEFSTQQRLAGATNASRTADKERQYMKIHDNLVAAHLRHFVTNNFGDVETYKLVLSLGRSYRGAPRPKEFRRGPPKKCFQNAGRLAFRGRGIYVEGYALSRLDDDWPKHHAWITLNGSEAVDVTWAKGETCEYFGIAVQQDDLIRWLTIKGYWGVLDPVVPELSSTCNGRCRGSPKNTRRQLRFGLER